MTAESRLPPGRRRGALVAIPADDGIGRKQERCVEIQHIEIAQPQHQAERTAHCDARFEHAADHESKAGGAVKSAMRRASITPFS